jgi:uncharacterized protein (DUF2147 family)
MRYIYILVILLTCFMNIAPAGVPHATGIDAKASRVCGKWESADKDLVVEVYIEKSTFKAKIIWFSGGVSKAKPMETITDIKNPDPSLRSRKVLGLNVVENLKYDAASNSWEGGRIYEVQSGKYWNAAAYLQNNSVLKVKGYWKIKLLGKTMTFKRI